MLLEISTCWKSATKAEYLETQLWNFFFCRTQASHSHWRRSCCAQSHAGEKGGVPAGECLLEAASSLQGGAPAQAKEGQDGQEGQEGQEEDQGQMCFSKSWRPGLLTAAWSKKVPSELHLECCEFHNDYFVYLCWFPLLILMRMSMFNCCLSQTCCTLRDLPWETYLERFTWRELPWEFYLLNIVFNSKAHGRTCQKLFVVSFRILVPKLLG